MNIQKTMKKGMKSTIQLNDDKNNNLADKYRELANKEKNVIFGGRLSRI